MVYNAVRNGCIFVLCDIYNKSEYQRRMNFSGIKPKDILDWINKRDNGDDTYYLKGKQDTQEAINLFQSLYGMTFMLVDKLYEYL